MDAPVTHVDIAAIGGGAAGLMAAHRAASGGLRVAVLEKNERVGKKLLATGNGRCNLLTLCVDAARFHGGGAHAAAALALRYPPESVLAVFADMGLLCRAEEAGRVYPACGQASAVLDALRFACARAGVQVCAGARVTALRHTPGTAHPFTLSLENGRLHARCVLIATGGMAAPALGGSADGYALLEAFGHRRVPLRPAIAPLRTAPDAVRGLKGVRADTRLTLACASRAPQHEDGEVLFTDSGISGIAAMQCARAAGEALAAGQSPVLHINLLPACTQAQVRAWVAHSAVQAESPEALGALIVHKRIALALLRIARGAQREAALSHAQQARFAALLQDWPLTITGVGAFAQAQVTAGGISLADFDADTLCSRLIPGLYAAGEVLDVDGDCGGYNLYWAWMSALTAADGMLRAHGRAPRTPAAPLPHWLP